MNQNTINIETKLNIAILSWIPMLKNGTTLCINIPERIDCFFKMHGLRATYLKEEDVLRKNFPDREKYDFIFAFDLIEKVKEPVELLLKIKSLMKDSGVLYLGTDNRLGLRYFCGDIEPGTGKAFVAVEDYNSIDKNVSLDTRLYARNEIEDLLDEAELKCRKFYAVLPNLSAAQLVYADGYLPHERLATRYMPMYREPSMIFAREEWMYDSIISNGMFHKMANSYLIEIHFANNESKMNDVLHVTLSADRGEEYSCATVIYSDRVEKIAMYKEGEKRLFQLKKNDDDLREHGVPVIDSKIDSGIYVMPRIESMILERYLQQLLVTNPDKFLEVFDRYRDIIYQSSDVIEINEKGPILKRCYLDLVPLNCFYQNDNFLFYDQEFFLEKEAANLVLWRALVIIYDDNPTLNGKISISEMMDRYGITPYAEEFAKKSDAFLKKLRNQDKLADFNERNLRNINKVMDNKRKMEHVLTNWDEKKEKLKETCFDNLYGKEIYVFGSGRFADEFICMYRYDYIIAGIIDNNEEKHGSEFYDYKIYSPEILRDKNPEKYKVIICIKDCNNILMQLMDMGVRNIGVFDIHYSYPGRQKYMPGKDGLAEYQQFYKAPAITEGKKYHIGYIAGVFDLFHLGHLNMFRRAKELCDYLIVGVVSDDGVRINKSTEPFIPFEERIEMVRSCKYVDEAVEIPFEYCRTPEAFRKYHFDVQFSGSDYEKDPGWLAMKDYLEQNGSTMVFFPYTEQTSSTKIKSLINKELGEQKDNAIGQKLFKKGYMMFVPKTLDLGDIMWIKDLTQKCQNFVLGIPDEWIFARIYGDAIPYDVKNAKKTLESLEWISEVKVLTHEQLLYQNILDEVKFDVCFYGTEYGKKFLEDSTFFKRAGIAFEPVIPTHFADNDGKGSVRFAIENLKRKQKIVLFGTGAYFDIYMKKYSSIKPKYMPAYAVDNDSAKWGTEKAGVKIFSPDKLLQEKADDVLVVICSKNYVEILSQLRGIGEFDYRVLLFNNSISLLEEFGISALMEKKYLANSHRILTILLEEFDKVCRDNDLHYYVICGSLIGVVRHKGMIPWDDDIDIAMPRADFKKLRKIARKCWNKRNDTFQFVDYDDIGGGAFLDCMPRLFYMKENLPTKCFDKVVGKAKSDIEDRMFLDIYVMDNAHPNDKIHSFCTNIAMKGIYNLMMGHRSFVDYEEYSGVINEKTIATMKKVHKIGSFLPLKFLSFWYDTFSRSANLNPKCKDYILNSCAIRCIELKYPKKSFGDGLRLPFENIEVMVPSDYDAQLKDMRYNNYMEFPRLSVRKPSHYFNSDIEIW